MPSTLPTFCLWCALIVACISWLPSEAQCLPGPVLSIGREPRTIQVSGVPGINYAVEATAGLNVWERLATNRSATGIFELLLPDASAPARFFRSLEVPSADGRGAVWLFDGQSGADWIPDSAFRIENCAFVGGSFASQLPVNHFICTTRRFTNFVLRLKFKLVGVDGFVNAGVQFRSVRNANASVSGYQADIGEGVWGSLYDESRRNVILAAADQAVVLPTLKLKDWNDYTIRAAGSRIQLFLNGIRTVDFIETSASIPLHGLIGLQIHGGTRAEASYKEISIEEL